MKPGKGVSGKSGSPGREKLSKQSKSSCDQGRQLLVDHSSSSLEDVNVEPATTIPSLPPSHHPHRSHLSPVDLKKSKFVATPGGQQWTQVNPRKQSNLPFPLIVQANLATIILSILCLLALSISTLSLVRNYHLEERVHTLEALCHSYRVKLSQETTNQGQSLPLHRVDGRKENQQSTEDQRSPKSTYIPVATLETVVREVSLGD